MRSRARGRIGLALAAAAAALACCRGRRGSAAFVGSSAPRAPPRDAQRGPLAREALSQGDAVMVVGLVSKSWPTTKIAISMLKEKGYVLRPVVAKATDMEEVLGPGIEGYVFGSGEAMPSVKALVIADEAPTKPEVVTAFVRRLADSGPLSRVTMLARPNGEKWEAAVGALKSACEAAGVEWSVVDVGRLRGGGSGTLSKHALGSIVYDVGGGLLGTDELEEESFDISNRGMDVGDVSFVSFGPFGSKPPDTNRLLAAAALVESLALDEAAGGTIGLISPKVEFDQARSRGDWLPDAGAWSEVWRKKQPSPA